MRHLLFAALLLLCCAYGCIATVHTSQVWPGRGESIWGPYVVKGDGDEVKEGGWDTLRIAVDARRLFNEFEYCDARKKKVSGDGESVVDERVEVSEDDKTLVDGFHETECEARDKVAREKVRELLQNVLPVAAKMHVDRLAIKRGDDDKLLIRSNTGYVREPCRSHIPKKHRESGLPNVDFVVYVGLWNDGTSTTICSFDEKTGRPTSAVIRFNVDDLERLRLGHTVNNKGRVVRIAAHEIAHGLGFSTKASKFSELIGATEDGNHMELVSEKIKEVLKGHNCEKASGIKIDDDSMDRPYPHFDGTIAKNELMSPYNGRDNRMLYSNLTLAVFESTGYYKVDYGRSEKETEELEMNCGSL